MEHTLYVLPACGRSVACSIVLCAKRKKLCWMEHLVNRQPISYSMRAKTYLME